MELMMQFFLEPILLVFIGSKLLFFLFYERIRFLFYKFILIDALLHCFFMRWLINLTYWMEFFIVGFVFSPLLSPFHLSASFFFASHLFMQKRFQLLQWY